MKIGFLELIVVFAVALLAVGPDKLPAYARKLGAALREFRKATADVSRDVRKNVIEPLEEAQRPIREAIEPLAELDKEVRRDIRDIEKDLKNIGKPAGPEKKPEPPGSGAAPSGGTQERQAGEHTEDTESTENPENTGGDNL